VSFPPDLLDELARVFARVALEQLLKESPARGARQEHEGETSVDAPTSKVSTIADEKQQG